MRADQPASPPRGFRRAGLTVLMGSAAGVGLGLVLTPVLARLVTPGVFGSFMTLSALASVFVGVSTMRLEVLGQREHEEDDAQQALKLGLTLAVTLGSGLLVAALVAWSAGLVSVWMLAVGPMVTLASLQLIGTASLVRAQQYGRLARGNFAQSGGMAVLQTGLAVASPTVGSLLAGYLVARLVWLRHLPGLLWRKADVLSVWSLHRAYALTAGSSAAVNSLASQVPILVPAALFGDQAAGWFAMAVRILIAPLALVGQAAAAAAVGELSSALRVRDRGAQRVFRRGARDLAVVGAVPAIAAGALGVVAVPYLLGDEWSETGVIVSVLAAGAWAQLAVAPFSQTLNLADRSGWLLRWDVTRLVLLLTVFVLPAALGLGIVVTAVCYSAALVVLYAVLALMCDRAFSAR